MGGPHPHRQRPRVVVLATVPVYRGRPDLLSGLVIFYGRGAVAQDLDRVSAGGYRLHALSDRQRGLRRHALPGTLLVRHPGPDWPAAIRLARTLLDSGREKQLALLLVATRKPRRVSLQPAPLVSGWVYLRGSLLSIFSHVSGSAYGERTGSPCSQS